MSNLKIGLALGSGGARGWAHVGVLQRLQELGIRPYCIAGTSIGSIVGAAYATGQLMMLESLASELDWKRAVRIFFEVGIPRSGLISGKNVIGFLKELIPARTIEEIPIPYAAIATDLSTEQEVILDSGDLFDAIRASISIPGIFSPPQSAKIKGHPLIDGGFVDPLPVSVCRAMGADAVIAVDINLKNGVLPPRKKDESGKTTEKKGIPPHLAAFLEACLKKLETFPVVEKLQRLSGDSPSIFDVLTRTMRLAENQITRRELEIHPPDILIQPAVGHIMTLEFHRGNEAIRQGERAVRPVLPQLEKLLSR